MGIIGSTRLLFFWSHKHYYYQGESRESVGCNTDYSKAAMGALVVEAHGTHTASMIFLHGLGDSGHGWAPVVRDFGRRFPFMRFILPHAPSRSVTINGNLSMPAWYDIYTLSETDDREDETGLRESAQTLVRLMEEEHTKRNIPPERIFIGGFSQGAAVSIFTLLAGLLPWGRLAGIVALSGYVPCRQYFYKHPPSLESVKCPIFMGHGTEDPVIQYRWHKDSVQFIRNLHKKLPITVRKYEGMGHSACEEELVDIIEFIDEQLQPKTTTTTPTSKDDL